MNAAPSKSWLPVAAVSVTLVLWASAFVAIRHLGKDFSPGSLSLGRLLVGAIALGVVAAMSKRMPRPTGREWASIVTIGVLWFGVYNVSLNEGEHHVDAGTASMLLQVSPILIAVLATMFLGEKFTTYLTIGLALAFSGVVLIGTADSDSGSRDLLGVALCLLSAAAYSISVILQKPLVARLPALHVTWLACTVGAVACVAKDRKACRSAGDDAGSAESGHTQERRTPRRCCTRMTIALLANIAVALVALLHVWILVLEMFLWATPLGRRAFGTTVEQAEASKVLAANQGLYNGFLAAGLLWGLTFSHDTASTSARAIAPGNACTKTILRLAVMPP